ncbi:peptidoglycan DD-metalloendopeptidase family protein [Thiomicrorhabdus sp. 6S2-11]|uniref:Peptidoglycan DD-metalloendopeptidase family protein n=1 Tax=Thiomicrorhabdus marina TaxID=2818442 RepID=A0ABS3Q2P4_9GAMM|nr:M23 family metallopeptidase [Thiomicrorhabdus marina]MBO1926609.1 peptidoglycan DD-metalloendopeptidase family protein [Thiomicrorhabdus marina]
MPYTITKSFKTIATSSFLLVSAIFLSACSSQLKYDPSAQNDGRNAPDIKGTQPLSNGSCPNIYIVSPGDSLSKIANKCNVSLELLQEVNDIRRADLIYINQELRIPNQSSQAENKPTAYQDETPQTVTQPTSNTQVYSRDQSSYQPQSIDGSKKKGFDWLWPMNKQTDYRFVRDDKGISALEIYGFVGQSVFAMAEGRVAFAGDGISDLGNMVMIRHPDGKLSVYAHNDKLFVKRGDQVKAGQKIAAMGSTGITQRPKLYVETRYQGQKISIKKILNN